MTSPEYLVLLDEVVASCLRAIPSPAATAARKTIEALAIDPWPPTSKQSSAVLHSREERTVDFWAADADEGLLAYVVLDDVHHVHVNTLIYLPAP